MGLVFIENGLFWVYDKNTGFWKIEVGCCGGLSYGI
jgi:hypothetical protein